MKKNITFFRQSGSRKWLESLTVETENLSPMARFLAMSISTTDMADDLSHVTLDCRYTNHELFTTVLADDTGRYTESEKQNARDNLDKERQFGIGDMVQSHEYIWDSLKDSETPEEYFERHAKYIRIEKFPYLRDAVLRGYENGATHQHIGIPVFPFMTIKDIANASGLSLRKLAERFGIPYRTMENWSAGVSKPPEYVINMMREILGL